MKKLNINQWAEEDRPREKMERLGAEALSDAELLAILIGSGCLSGYQSLQIFSRTKGNCYQQTNISKRHKHWCKRS